MTCETCNGEGWVCESHPERQWGDGDAWGEKEKVCLKQENEKWKIQRSSGLRFSGPWFHG